MKAKTTDPMDVLFPIPPRRRWPLAAGIAGLAVAGLVVGLAACGADDPAQQSGPVPPVVAVTQTTASAPTSVPSASATTAHAAPAAAPATTEQGRSDATRERAAGGKRHRAKATTPSKTAKPKPARKVAKRVIKKTAAKPAAKKTPATPKPAKTATPAPTKKASAPKTTASATHTPVVHTEKLGSETAIWATVNANVRSDTGTDHAVVGGLTAGQKVTGRLIGDTGWWKIGDGRYVTGSVVSTHKPAPAPTTKPQPESHSEPAPGHGSSDVQSILASYLPGPATLIVQPAVGCGRGTPGAYRFVGCTTGSTIRIAIGSAVPPRSETARSLVLHEYGHVLEGRWATSVQRNRATRDVGWEPLADCIALRLGATGSPGGYTTAAGCGGERGQLAAAIVAGRDYVTTAQQQAAKKAADEAAAQKAAAKRAAQQRAARLAPLIAAAKNLGVSSSVDSGSALTGSTPVYGKPDVDAKPIGTLAPGTPVDVSQSWLQGGGSVWD